MYELRELGDHYFGLFLVIVLALLTTLKLIYESRLVSMTFFWQSVNNTNELNKPFKLARAFSIIPFLIRSMVFGILLDVFVTKHFSAASFNLDAAIYAGSFLLFWGLRAFLEGAFMSFFNQQETLFKIFYVRTLHKEKLAFLFCCLLFAGASVGFSGLPTVIFVGSYVVGFVAIHLNIFKLYLRQFHVKQVYIILYICASEIAPVWLATQTLKF